MTSLESVGPRGTAIVARNAALFAYRSREIQACHRLAGMVGGQLAQLVAEALWSHRSLRCNTRPTLDAARELLAQGCTFHTAIETGCLPAIAWRASTRLRLDAPIGAMRRKARKEQGAWQMQSGESSTAGGKPPSDSTPASD